MKTKNEVLETKEDVLVKAEKGFKPTDFFINKEGLYVWSDFKSRILEKAEETKEDVELKLASFDLIKDASDKEIEEDLPEKHIFSETDACAFIASLIQKQPKGEEGTLLNNGYANLFYTPAFVVRVRWYGGGWRVRAWRRGGDGWDAGGRVFSPAI